MCDVPEYLRLVFPDPYELCTRPQSVTAYLSCMMLDRSAAKGVNYLLSLLQSSGVAPDYCRSQRSAVTVEENTCLALAGYPQSQYVLPGYTGILYSSGKQLL